MTVSLSLDLLCFLEIRARSVACLFRHICQGWPPFEQTLQSILCSGFKSQFSWVWFCERHFVQIPTSLALLKASSPDMSFQPQQDWAEWPIFLQFLHGPPLALLGVSLNLAWVPCFLGGLEPPLPQQACSFLNTMSESLWSSSIILRINKTCSFELSFPGDKFRLQASLTLDTGLYKTPA